MTLDRRAFNPYGATVLISGATIAPDGLQVLGAEQYRIYNDGSVTAFIAFGEDASTAKANAVIPTNGNPKSSLPIPAGKLEVISAPIASFFSAITGSSTASVYITAGRGL